jgi:hypothetical protein
MYRENMYIKITMQMELIMAGDYHTPIGSQGHLIKPELELSEDSEPLLARQMTP